jgi:small GTP-binding protein
LFSNLTLVSLKCCFQRTATLKASFLTKRINDTAGNRITIDLWVWIVLSRFIPFSQKLDFWFSQDTAGQERFAAIAPLYYKDSDGALVCYDVSDKKTFARASHWCAELRTMLKDEVSLILCGTKCDLPNVVSEAEVQQLCTEVKAEHMLTSARLDQGVEEVFLALCASTQSDPI